MRSDLLLGILGTVNAIRSQERKHMNIASSARSDLTLRTLRVAELAERCISEVNAYQNGEHSDELSAMELFRRAIGQRDPVARVAVQQCFNEMMLRWLRSHPQREMACWLDSEEHYVAQGFARFWLATTQKQGLEFQTLSH
jgi:septal ring-binding cell division protein DamX